MSRDELDRAIAGDKLRASRLRDYHKNMRIMNEKIAAWNAKARALEQQRLFDQAAAALPPDTSGGSYDYGESSSSGSSSSSDSSGTHRTLSRNDPSIQASFSHLELHATASHEDVRRKFKELALRYHPDRSSHDTTEVFQKILQSRDMLEEFFICGGI